MLWRLDVSDEGSINVDCGENAKRLGANVQMLNLASISISCSCRIESVSYNVISSRKYHFMMMLDPVNNVISISDTLRAKLKRSDIHIYHYPLINPIQDP